MTTSILSRVLDSTDTLEDLPVHDKMNAGFLRYGHELATTSRKLHNDIDQQVNRGGRREPIGQVFDLSVGDDQHAVFEVQASAGHSLWRYMVRGTVAAFAFYTCDEAMLALLHGKANGGRADQTLVAAAARVLELPTPA